MPVKVQCPGCKKVLNAPEKARGKAVRCPNCQTPVRVPGEGAKPESAKAGAAKTGAAKAPARKKAASKGPDSVAMIAALDLGKMEDHHTRICPLCEANVPEGELECPKCGVNVETGLFTEKQLRKKQRKGPDTALFYRDAVKSGPKFVKANMFLAVRTSILLTVFAILFLACIFMALYVSTWPLQSFWIFLAIVCSLVPPGWLWQMQTRIIDASLVKKDKIKKKDYPLDVFLCASLGVKAYAWLIVFMIPVQVFTGLIGGICIAMGQPIAGYVFFGLGVVIALSMLPIVMAHMAMPVTYRAWLMPRIGRIFRKVAWPTLYSDMLVVASALLFLVAIGATSAIFAKDVGAVVGRLRHNADVKWAIAYQPPLGEKIPVAIINKSKEKEVSLDPPIGFFVPFGVLILCTGAFGFVAVFAMRIVGKFAYYFREDLDLISQEEELKYVAKTEDEHSGRETTVKELVIVYSIIFGLALMFGTLYGGISESVNIGDGIGGALVVAAALVFLIGSVMVLGAAFEEGAMWGIAIIVFGLLPVEMIFVVTNWRQARPGFLIQLSSLPFGFLGLIIGAVAGSRSVL